MSYRIFFLTAMILALANPVRAGEGDAAAGKRKAAPCLECHNAGDAIKYPSIPILAGQSRAYLAHQMYAFRRSGQGRGVSPTKEFRHHAIMDQLVIALTDREIADFATFFAAQACRDSRANMPARVPLIVNRCAACHNHEGRGNYSRAPKLAGQNRLYLLNQLQAFFRSAGGVIDWTLEIDRHHRIMTRQMGMVSERDMGDIAAYYAALPCQ